MPSLALPCSLTGCDPLLRSRVLFRAALADAPGLSARVGANGLLILCSVNPEWSDFNPSPQSRQYLSAGRLASLAEAAGFRTELLGAFSTESPGPKATMVSWLKRTAVALHLIPSTMRGKRLLKRLFLGELVSFPSAVEDGLAPYCPPVSIDSRRPVTDYKVLFALCRPR